MADELMVLEFARVEITWAGHHAELPDGMAVDATDDQVRAMVQEAVANGFHGMPADPNVNLRDFVVDRYGPSEARAQHLVTIRPKVAFGAYKLGNS